MKIASGLLCIASGPGLRVFRNSSQACSDLVLKKRSSASTHRRPQTQMRSCWCRRRTARDRHTRPTGPPARGVWPTGPSARRKLPRTLDRKWRALQDLPRSCSKRPNSDGAVRRSDYSGCVVGNTRDIQAPLRINVHCVSVAAQLNKKRLARRANAELSAGLEIEATRSTRASPLKSYFGCATSAVEVTAQTQGLQSRTVQR